MNDELDWSGIPDDKPGAGKKTEFKIIPEDTTLEARLIGMKKGVTQNNKNFYEAEFLIVDETKFEDDEGNEVVYTNRHVWTRLYTDKGANFKMRDLMKALDLYKPNDAKRQAFEVHDVLQKQFQVVIGVNAYNPEKPRKEVKFINTSRALGAAQGGTAQPAAAGASGGFKL